MCLEEDGAVLRAGFTFRARKTIWLGHIYAHGFLPAASRKALKAISRTIRRARRKFKRLRRKTKGAP
jgi:hypothetical protein